MNSNAVLALLRRLENQNVWRASYSAVPGCQQMSAGGLMLDGGTSAEVLAEQQQQQESLLNSLLRQQAMEQIQLMQQQQQQQQGNMSWLNHKGMDVGARGNFGGFGVNPVDGRGRMMMPHHHHQQQQQRQHMSTVHVPEKVNETEWYDDSTMSAADAIKLLVDRIRESGPVKQRHLQHLYQRCTTAEDLEKALGLTRLNYLARGELQQHDHFSHRTSSILLQQAMKIGAPELAKRALVRSAEFGFSPANTRLFNHLLIYYSKQEDLRNMLETYELMKRAGPNPDSETCFILVKGSVDCGRSDIAKAIVEEFDAMGARVRDGVRLYIQQHDAGQPKQTMQL